jgi:hypothetical protein
MAQILVACSWRWLIVIVVFAAGMGGHFLQ